MLSNYNEELPEVLRIIHQSRARSVLEIGKKQLGQYALMIKEILAIHSLEENIQLDAFYIGEECPSNLEILYQKTYTGDILLKLEKLKKYDVIVLSNDLEYFTYEEGQHFVENLIQHCNQCVLITTPIYTENTIWSIPYFRAFNFNVIRFDYTNLFVFYPKVLQLEEASHLNLPSEKERKSLCIAYILPHKNLTGGLKMLLQQMKHLREKGHKIYAVFKTDNELEEILPKWMQIEVDKKVRVPFNKRYDECLQECDVICAGWVTQLQELSDSKIPVIYWEQGHEMLCGDFPRKCDIEKIRNVLTNCYTSRCNVLSVSKFIAQCIQAKFGRRTQVLSNGIDTTFYHPGPKGEEVNILLVGNPMLEFKGFGVILNALKVVNRIGYKFKVTWVCQMQPVEQSFEFPVTLMINPSQEVLATQYREATMHIFGSWYEGFGMPPLEAMASGTAVICTRCGGVDDYITHGYNALTVSPGDIRGLAAYIVLLIKSPEARKQLEKNGIETALKYDYKLMINRLEQFIYNTIDS